MERENKISAKIIKDSISERGKRITTFELVFPRYILPELNTHRVFSKNSASSRAIPFNKMVKSVEENPFVPIAWQKEHKGMQGSEYITEEKLINRSIEAWLTARDNAIEMACELHGDNPLPEGYEDLKLNVTKQLCNRLLEPFMYHKVLLTATEFEDFFRLRCPSYELGRKVFKSWQEAELKCGTQFEPSDLLSKLKLNKGQAEIHIMDLAEKMYDAMQESIPDLLEEGEWHLPYSDNLPEDMPTEEKLKICTARCARLSYQTLGDNPTIDFTKDISLYTTLLEEGHMSPFEHCAQAMDEETYFNSSISVYIQGETAVTFGVSRNFRGFLQYRSLIENS